jgi:hypothetical protein
VALIRRQFITYTLPASVTGCDLTNIVAYGGGLMVTHQQKYTIYYPPWRRRDLSTRWKR